MFKKLIFILIAATALGFFAYSEFKPVKSGSIKTQLNSWDKALIAGNDSLIAFKLPEAKTFYSKSLEEAEKIWGKDSQQAGVSYNKLGIVALRENNLDQAEQYLGQAWAITDQVLKDNDKRKGYILANYAKVLKKLFRLEEALKLEERGMQIIDLVEPPIWRDRADTKLGLASVNRDLGRVDNIKDLTREAIQDFKRELKADFKSKFERELRADATTEFAYRMIDFGQYDEAIYFAKQAVELSHSEFGPDTIKYSNSLKALALAYYRVGKIADAENFYKQSVNSLKTQSEESVLRGMLFAELAWIEYERYNLSGSIRYAEIALHEISESLGNKHPDICYYHRILAGFYLQTGDFQKASDHADKALGMALQIQANDRPDLIGALKVFVYARLATKNINDVLPIIYKVSEKSYQGQGTLNLYARVDLLSALSDLCRQLGKYEDAQKFIEQAVEIVPPDSSWSIDILLSKAKNLRDMGQLDKALDFANQGLKKANEIAPKSWRELWALRVLANTSRIAKKYDQSAEFYRQAIELINSTPWLLDDTSNKLNLYKELGDLYQEKSDDPATLFEILKIYRTVYKKSQYKSIFTYLPKLLNLQELSKKYNDDSLSSELAKEIEQYKLLFKKLSKLEQLVATAIDEELQRQRKESLQPVEKPKSLTL